MGPRPPRRGLRGAGVGGTGFRGCHGEDVLLLLGEEAVLVAEQGQEGDRKGTGRSKSLLFPAALWSLSL